MIFLLLKNFQQNCQNINHNQYYTNNYLYFLIYRYASALSVLAENRKLLEHIFITKEYSNTGVYAMRLCKDGQWTDVIVDDRFPCIADGRLAFCKVSLNQGRLTNLQKCNLHNVTQQGRIWLIY